jgi:predicted dehydrogenase
MHAAVLIGAGDRGSVYAKTLGELNIPIASIYDIDKERAANLAQKLKGYSTPKIVGTLEESLNTPGADMAFICIPAYYHADYAMKAIHCGLHVLIEKPFDLDYGKAEELGILARRKNRILAVGHQYRNYRNMRSLKDIMEFDLIGRPAVLRFTDIRECRPKIAMHDAEKGNCGPMMDMSCHFVDIMQWAFKSKPVKVTARHMTYSKYHERYAGISYKAPDTGIIMAEFASGDIGMITVCWGIENGVASSSPIDGFGPKGFIRPFQLWDINDSVTVNTPKGDIQVEFSEEEQLKFRFPEKTTVEYFVAAIEGTGEVQVGFNDAITALTTTLASLKSSVSHRSENLVGIIEEKPNAITCLNIHDI